MTAPAYEPSDRNFIDVVVVLDKSGSMEGSKLETAKKTLDFIIKNLRDGDRLALITYDTDVYQDFGLIQMTESGKAKCHSKCQMIRSGSMTNLSGGLLRGIEVLQQRSTKNPVASVLLLTDGLANVGIQSEQHIISAMKEALIGTEATVYTFGFGSDHQATMLKNISEAGQGMYYYVETVEHIPQCFADCLGGLLSVIGQNVSVTVSTQAGTIISANTTRSVAFNEQKTSCTVSVGDIQSEETRNLVFTFKLDKQDAPSAQPQQLASVQLRYFNVINGAFEDVTSEVNILRPEIVQPEQPNALVVKQRQRVQVSSATAEALKLAEAGKIPEARAVLEKSLSDLDQYQSEYSQELRDDLLQGLEVLQNKERYRREGAQRLCGVTQTHEYERSNVAMHSRGFVSYCTPMKSRMKAAFM